ncbi:hypothetical protein C5Y96_05165 [Blastopirellula marina]|uniref:Carboxypeptidase regulatory-like domain-containing protein n=1 Tax=Blastopirellula marina TaxID=124 RepID=A0A2S8G467_9BACT|nr:MULTISPECIES: hypothetical protein [Pirellulaceae]PQO39249.1 hypothetical protein C5Y96_05165 [Blastopirellula marina]RCS55557.1 hypothetical protein DTL36_05175 [Bremerella cremea]
MSISGCTRASFEPRYQVSGTVTYDGKPVPSGLVKFQPDVEKGGYGPGGYAPIKDGEFCTAEGICAGPVKVSICGFDGIPLEVVNEDGKTVMEETNLFKEYPTLAEIKHANTVIDFAVPEL